MIAIGRPTSSRCVPVSNGTVHVATSRGQEEDGLDCSILIAASSLRHPHEEGGGSILIAASSLRHPHEEGGGSILIAASEWWQVAVDLPGFGRSESEELKELIGVQLLREVRSFSDTHYLPRRACARRQRLADCLARNPRHALHRRLQQTHLWFVLSPTSYSRAWARTMRSQW